MCLDLMAEKAFFKSRTKWPLLGWTKKRGKKFLPTSEKSHKVKTIVRNYLASRLVPEQSSNFHRSEPKLSSIHLDHKPRLHFFDKLPKKRENCEDFGFSLSDPDLSFSNLPSHSDSAKYFKGLSTSFSQNHFW